MGRRKGRPLRIRRPLCAASVISVTYENAARRRRSRDPIRATTDCQAESLSWQDETLYSASTAIAVISTFAPFGIPATWIVARAGGAFLKNVA
jgi:hypothetical protein